MLVGAHIPVAWGYDHAAEYAAQIGAEAIQIFAKSPRRWVTPPTDPQRAAGFAASRDRLALGPLFTHTAYLINLGARDDLLWERSTHALADEIARACLLEATGVITHIGTRYDPDDIDACAARVAGACRSAWELSGAEPGSVRLLFENTAGAGTTFGGSFDELGALLAHLERTGPIATGLCLDTCHAWAMGIDVGSVEGWASTLDHIERCCGAGRIHAIHANDCKGARGAHLDRHEWIGDGTIGNAGFSAMLCEPRLAGVPAIVEMPGEIPAKDTENIARLKGLRAGCSS